MMGGGSVSVSDASATQSGGTFMPTFGAVGLPSDPTVSVVVIAVVALVGIVLWKRL